jgi:hypothetical protein
VFATADARSSSASSAPVPPTRRRAVSPSLLANPAVLLRPDLANASNWLPHNGSDDRHTATAAVPVVVVNAAIRHTVEARDRGVDSVLDPGFT